MSVRVAIQPELYEWACERAGKSPDELTRRFRYLPDWISGDEVPTLKQLEEFAAATHVPIGALFLSSPPEEKIPIPDLRTVGDVGVGRPSADLLDTIYICQRRQDWYREHARENGETPLDFVGSARVGDDVIATAARIRQQLELDEQVDAVEGELQRPMREHIERIEDLGVLVMVNGVVGNDTHRKLDPDEFRGFVLADNFAPLIFVNGADAKVAQMFTLAHELVHLWVNESGLLDVVPGRESDREVERWCNAVAAEVLVPRAILVSTFRERSPLRVELTRLQKVFGVSRAAILRRLHDAGLIDRETMWSHYPKGGTRPQRATGGGDFYRTTAARVSRRFARAVYVSTWEGRTGFTEAFRLLGLKNTATFERLGDALGVATP